MDSATDGAILFSLGTQVNMSRYLTEDKRNVLLHFFSTLKQKVIMKWEIDSLPNRPENVLIGKWLPQDAILAHENVKLFISHCGKHSVNEARFHGVPILGMPVFGDQHINLKIIMDEGWAVPFSYAFMDGNSLRFALNETLNNTRYAENVGRTMRLSKDRPFAALDTAIYWVEYVLRHNGANHMQSQAVHLNWFQYHSLDVIAFLMAVIYVNYKLSKWILRYMIWICCLRRKKVVIIMPNVQEDFGLGKRANVKVKKVAQKFGKLAKTKSD